jgi:hypothetical protein
MGYRSTMSGIVSFLAEAYLAAGQLPAASDHARRALALARECGERFQEARGLWILGQIHAHPDHADLEAAEQACRQSLMLASALDMRPLVAECHLALGKLSHRTGNRRQAEEYLATDNDVSGDGYAALAGKGGRRAGGAPVTPCLSLRTYRQWSVAIV